MNLKSKYNKNKEDEQLLPFKRLLNLTEEELRQKLEHIEILFNTGSNVKQIQRIYKIPIIILINVLDYLEGKNKLTRKGKL